MIENKTSSLWRRVSLELNGNSLSIEHVNELIDKFWYEVVNSLPLGNNLYVMLKTLEINGQNYSISNLISIDIPGCDEEKKRLISILQSICEERDDYYITSPLKEIYLNYKIIPAINSNYSKKTNSLKLLIKKEINKMASQERKKINQ